MAKQIEGHPLLALWLVGWLPKAFSSGHRDQETSKDSPPNLALYCVSSAGTRVGKTAFSD
jgi:hypothetical protein